MKEFGLIGYPLKNSFSENYFNSRFLSLALLDHVYRNFPIEHISGITALLESHPHLQGFNVTIPHKQTIIPYLDELHENAREANAVNCVKISRSRNGEQKLIGYNTDVYGFEMSLLPLIEGRKPLQALILGTGGAAKAVAFVLRKHHIVYTFVSRKPGNDALTYEELNPETMASHTLIVNCTPVGMFPDTEVAPLIPYAYITQKHIAYDLIYLPVETLFLKQFREQGATTKNGLEMLHLQAEKSWEIWRGR
jgi:shikimate dehydrogenase